METCWDESCSAAPVRPVQRAYRWDTHTELRRLQLTLTWHTLKFTEAGWENNRKCNFKDFLQNPHWNETTEGFWMFELVNQMILVCVCLLSCRRLWRSWTRMISVTTSGGSGLLFTEFTSTSCSTNTHPPRTTLMSHWWLSCPWTGNPPTFI